MLSCCHLINDGSDDMVWSGIRCNVLCVCIYFVCIITFNHYRMWRNYTSILIKTLSCSEYSGNGRNTLWQRSFNKASHSRRCYYKFHYNQPHIKDENGLTEIRLILLHHQMTNQTTNIYLWNDTIVSKWMKISTWCGRAGCFKIGYFESRILKTCNRRTALQSNWPVLYPTLSGSRLTQHKGIAFLQTLKILHRLY